MWKPFIFYFLETSEENPLYLEMQSRSEKNYDKSIFNILNIKK